MTDGSAESSVQAANVLLQIHGSPATTPQRNPNVVSKRKSSVQTPEEPKRLCIRSAHQTRAPRLDYDKDKYVLSGRWRLKHFTLYQYDDQDGGPPLYIPMMAKDTSEMFHVKRNLALSNIIYRRARVYCDWLSRLITINVRDAQWNVSHTVEFDGKYGIVFVHDILVLIQYDNTSWFIQLSPAARKTKVSSPQNSTLVDALANDKLKKFKPTFD